MCRKEMFHRKIKKNENGRNYNKYVPRIVDEEKATDYASF